MSNFLYWPAEFWTQNIHPRLALFVAFFGTFWLGLCVLVLYVLARLSNETLEKESFAFDKTILLDIHKLANPVLDRLMLSITQLGNPQVAVPITVVVFGFLWWQRDRLEAKIFALNAFGGAVLSTVLKLTFVKPRPQLWPQLITESTFSFPSGHALGSMVLYGFLAYLFATLYPRYDRAFYSIAVVLIIAIGFSRLYLGVHWPTDILAGYGIGFLWITVCISLLRLQKMKMHNFENT